MPDTGDEIIVSPVNLPDPLNLVGPGQFAFIDRSIHLPDCDRRISRHKVLNALHIIQHEQAIDRNASIPVSQVPCLGTENMVDFVCSPRLRNKIKRVVQIT